MIHIEVRGLALETTFDQRDCWFSYLFKLEGPFFDELNEKKLHFNLEPSEPLHFLWSPS